MKVPETPNGVLRLFEPFILMNGDSFTNLSQTREVTTRLDTQCSLDVICKNRNASLYFLNVSSCNQLLSRDF